MPQTNGQPISRTDANDLFVRHFDLKDRNRNDFLQVLSNDNEASRYYCGNTETYANQMDLLFLFDKDSLNRINEKIQAGDADGMMIFPGAHTDGKPTMMLFPVKYNGSGNDREYVILNEGEQHAGNGGPGAVAIFNGSTELPTSLVESQLY